MKIKIALIIERANVVLGGAERSVFELANALSAQGMQCDILAASGSTSVKNVHLLCEDIPKKRIPMTLFADRIKQFLAKNNYDIVHSFLPFDFADIYQPRGGSYAESIKQNAESFANPFIRKWKRSTSFFNYRRTKLLHAEKNLCKKSDGPVIAALSKYVATQFKTHYNLPDQRLFLVPNGVSLTKKPDFKVADELRSLILRQLSLKEAHNPALFLFAATNFRLKGLSPLIKALSLAAQKTSERPPFLIVAGSASSLRHRLLAAKYRVSKRILFLGPLRNINNALAITDVAVLPTFYDPSSRFILEALAVNKPVITTKFNGAADMFTADIHGKVIDHPANINALAAALNFYCSTDNIKNAQQAIQADNLRKNISNMRVADQLASLYTNIINNRS
jgi:UDP-glucose:(heptosyl)LPS alpha-1,3-glucosyltransferase